MRIALALCLLPSLAQANSAVWFDPDLGCGRAAVFDRTHQVADLPGCSGRLPKGAPQVEVDLREAKRALLDADSALNKNKLEKVDAALGEAERALALKPPMHPELPDRWEEAVPLYQRTVAGLRARRKLAPRITRIAATHRDAVAAWKAMTAHERDGGPAQALQLADACLKEMQEASTDGVDFAAEVELEKGRSRPLAEARTECTRAHDEAGQLVAAEEAAAKARRMALRRKLRGDRLKVFDQHPGALPECEGTQAIPARAAVWRYTSNGSVEVCTFRGNKLLSRAVQPQAKK
jgi:hypothetical protein